MIPVTKYLPRKSKRESAYAVNTPMTKAISVVAPAMMRLFISARVKFTLASGSSAAVKLESVRLVGHSDVENVSAGSRSAVTIIQ